MPVVYLASQSPRRRQLLHQIGVAHELLLPDAGEDTEALEAPLPGELPSPYVQRVTALKLQQRAPALAPHGLPPGVILAADTTVALGRRILGKPADDDEARAMLAALSGPHPPRAHGGGRGTGRRTLAGGEVSRVHVAPMSAAAIERYVATGEPRGKAGAYAIQGAYAEWMSRIDGSYSGIMGLPLFETAGLLRTAGVTC
jgi:septum formation protein